MTDGGHGRAAHVELRWKGAFCARYGWQSDALDKRLVADVVDEWREFLNCHDAQGKSRFRVP